MHLGMILSLSLNCILALFHEALEFYKAATDSPMHVCCRLKPVIVNRNKISSAKQYTPLE